MSPFSESCLYHAWMYKKTHLAVKLLQSFIISLSLFIKELLLMFGFIKIRVDDVMSCECFVFSYFPLCW